MIKHFCDGCGRELNTTSSAIAIQNVDDFASKSGAKLSLTITVAHGGDWCRYCVIDAVDSTDDRAKVYKEKQ